MLELFHDWHDPIPAVIEATAEEDILRNPIYESKPLRHWSRGRVTLLGDAAHTMTPNLGQGACQAIEDAVELGKYLKSEPDIVAALKRYERRRVRRTNMIVRLARLVGWVVQWENPMASRVRDALIKITPLSLKVRMLMWIVNYKGGVTGSNTTLMYQNAESIMGFTIHYRLVSVARTDTYQWSPAAPCLWNN